MPTRRFLHAALAGATALTFARGTPPDSMMGPGVSRELATERAANLSGVRYHMNLSVVSRDTARGTIAISFTAKRARDVVLDFRGPRLAEVASTAPPRRRNSTARIFAYRLPRSTPGHNEVTASFAALIAPAGASVIRFHDDRDNADYLYTLFVPSDANGLLPCFDQPDLKARLTLSLSVPAAWHALANGITDRVDTTSGGLTYRFHETDRCPRTCSRSRPDHGTSSPVARGTRICGFARRARKKSKWIHCRRKSRRPSGRSRSISTCRTRSSNSSTCSRPHFHSAAWSIRASRCSTRSRSFTASRRRSTSDSAAERRSTTKSRTIGSATT